MQRLLLAHPSRTSPPSTDQKNDPRASASYSNSPSPERQTTYVVQVPPHRLSYGLEALRERIVSTRPITVSNSPFPRNERTSGSRDSMGTFPCTPYPVRMSTSSSSNSPISLPESTMDAHRGEDLKDRNRVHLCYLFHALTEQSRDFNNEDKIMSDVWHLRCYWIRPSIHGIPYAKHMPER